MLTTKRLIITIVLMHVVPLAFTFYREALFNAYLPFLWCLALPFVAYLIWKQKAASFVASDKYSSLLKVALTTGFVFVLFMLQYWFLAQMSLQVQPLMFSAADQAVLFSVPPGETLAYILRNGLQVWLLAIGVALCYNILPKIKESGLLAKRFDNLAVLAWLLDWAVLVCLMFAVFSLMTLFVVNMGGILVKLAGGDQLLMPMLSVTVFILTLAMLNFFTQFHSKLRDKAQTKLSYAGILFRQAGFAVFAWVVSAVFMTLLPNSFLHDLYNPVYFSYIKIERFAQVWNFLVLSWPFFIVPALGVYMAKFAAGQSVVKTTVVFAAVPLLIIASLLSSMPSVAAVFMQWQPVLQFQEIALTDETARFYITPASIVFVISFGVLLLAMKCSKLFSQSIVAIMPDQYGRREHRSRAVLAHSFMLLIGLMMVYLMLGVYSMSLAAATYFLTALSAIVLFYYKGVTYTNSENKLLNMHTHKAVS